MRSGDFIRLERTKKGWSQKKLAEESGVALITINQYENHKRNPKYEQLLKIAEALNIGVSYLLDDSIEEHTGFTEVDKLLEPRLYFKQYVKITELLEKLNLEGQKKAVERVEDLTFDTRYMKEE